MPTGGVFHCQFAGHSRRSRLFSGAPPTMSPNRINKLDLAGVMDTSVNPRWHCLQPLLGHQSEWWTRTVHMASKRPLSNSQSLIEYRIKARGTTALERMTHKKNRKGGMHIFIFCEFYFKRKVIDRWGPFLL